MSIINTVTDRGHRRNKFNKGSKPNMLTANFKNGVMFLDVFEAKPAVYFWLAELPARCGWCGFACLANDTIYDFSGGMLC